MKDQFIAELTESSSSYVASKWILDRVPFVFKEDSEVFIKWKEKLSQKIGVDSKAIVFTGSSGCGFSLNPSKNFKDFNDDSDIDIAIISQHFFEVSWHYLRNLKIQRYRLTPKQKASIDDHVTRLIYWGTIATDKILSLLPFGKSWIQALTEIGNEPPFESRIVNIRIYRDFESLRAYQINNIEKLRDKLLKP